MRNTLFILLFSLPLCVCAQRTYRARVVDAETGEAKPFFIEFFLCNPALGGDEPVFGQIPGKPQRPSYLMVKAGAWGADAAQLHRFWGWNRIKVDWDRRTFTGAERPDVRRIRQCHDRPESYVGTLHRHLGRFSIGRGTRVR